MGRTEGEKHDQTRQREERIADMRLKGYTRREIIKWAREESGWGVSERQVDTYIKGAREILCHANSVDREAAWHEAHDRFHGWLREAQAMVDNAEDNVSRDRAIRLAQSIETEMDKLLGLNLQRASHTDVTMTVALIDLPNDEFVEKIVRGIALAEKQMKLIDTQIVEEEEGERRQIDDDNE